MIYLKELTALPRETMRTCTDPSAGGVWWDERVECLSLLTPSVQC